MFIQPFTQRETQRQHMVNKKNMKPHVTMINTPFLRICAETAYYDQKRQKNITLFSYPPLMRRLPVPARKPTGTWRQFPVCQPCHSNFRRSQVFMWVETHLKTVKRPEVRVFGGRLQPKRASAQRPGLRFRKTRKAGTIQSGRGYSFLPDKKRDSLNTRLPRAGGKRLVR